MATSPRAPALARVSIERSSGSGQSVARDAYAEPPLRLLRPRNGGHAVWIFSTTLGPGFLGGDDLRTDLVVGKGATCYVGSVGVGRAFSGASRVQQRLRVESGGLLIWAPDPLACGRGADLEIETEVSLEEGASLLLVDTTIAGRSALGERWCFRRLRSLLRVRVGQQERLREQLDLRPDALPVARHMGGVDAFGLLCAVGPRSQEVRATWLSEPPKSGGDLLRHGAPLGGDGALLRLASPRPDLLSRAAMTSLGNLSETLGDDPRACRF